MQLGNYHQSISWGRKELIRGHGRNGFYEIQELHNGNIFVKNILSGKKRLRLLILLNGFFRKKRLLDISQDGGVSFLD